MKKTRYTIWTNGCGYGKNTLGKSKDIWPIVFGAIASPILSPKEYVTFFFKRSFEETRVESYLNVEDYNPICGMSDRLIRLKATENWHPMSLLAIKHKYSNPVGRAKA